MKKGVQENNPILSMWQRVNIDRRIYKLAEEIRKNIGIPEVGFESIKESNSWERKIEGTKFESQLESNLILYLQKAQKIIPYEGLVTENSFRMMAYRFLLFNKLEEEYLASLKDSGMGIKMIKNGKTFNKFSDDFVGEVEDGVYIKVKPFSTIENILNFIESNRPKIRESLKKYSDINKLVKPKKIKASSHFLRDLMIVRYDELSKKEIDSVFGFKSSSKDDAISRVVKIMGEKRVNSDIVKAVKRRRKIK